MGKRAKWWTGNVRSIDVGQRLRLVPYWERSLVEPDRINVIIDPGPSFGAGDHPSTVMALELLESALSMHPQGSGSPSLLDVGTGTGVLAVAGKALGAGLTVALDIESAAIFTARRNLRLNGAGAASVAFFVGGAESVKGKFEVVAANLTGPVLMRLCGDLTRLAASHLILSGIAESVVEPVESAYGSQNLVLVERLAWEGWHASLFSRKIGG